MHDGYWLACVSHRLDRDAGRAAAADGAGGRAARDESITPGCLQEQTVMMMLRARYFVIALLVAISGWSAHPQTADNRLPADAGSGPRLINTCLITENVNRLVQFYEPILQIKARRSGEDYA